MAPPKHSEDSLTAFAKLSAEYKAGQAKKIDLKELTKLKKDLKRVCNDNKRHIQELREQDSTQSRTGRLRSGTKRTKQPTVKQSLYALGKYVNKGIEEAKQTFADDEIEYLEKCLKKVKIVSKLDFDQLKYLIATVFFDQLKGIKDGTIESEMHNKYIKQKGKSMDNLVSEIKTTLFSNEQRDYINGCLQGIFDATSLDSNGDIKHSEIDYLSTVLFYEITTMIVQYIHKFDTKEEAQVYMSEHLNETFESSGTK